MQELLRTGIYFCKLEVNLPIHQMHRQKMPLTEIEQDVYRFIEREPVHMEILLQKTGYPAGTLCSALFQMELKGYISEEAGGCYKRTFNV